MAQNEKILEGLQIIVTDLAQQADGHAIQSRVFASEGFTKLAEKYAEHAEEERGYVNQCIDRILDLGGEVKLEAKKEGPVCKNPIDWLKYDLEVSKTGLAWLASLVEEARTDYTTFDILKKYYQDEEEDMYWGQAQLELIECIGVQNWLIRQL
ncbi:MAG: bacterioferritin (cytochrome b1) [Clostridia bacterium]|nr:bacterioferritin (cytochrome b1) [Clostridia bacterium]